MKLLAVETSTQACSVALMINDEVIERFELAPKTHTLRVLPMVDELMADAELLPQQLDAVAFSCGPGSFTGVRIATAVIQGIAFGADLPVVPVSTLAALAHDYFTHPQQTASLAYVAMDARIEEVFWGMYQRNIDGYAELMGAEAVIPPEAIPVPTLPGVAIGSGWSVYHAKLTERFQDTLLHIASEQLPRARAIAQLGVYGVKLGHAVAVEDAMPVYLRDKVAKTEAERQLEKSKA